MITITLEKLHAKLLMKDTCSFKVIAKDKHRICVITERVWAYGVRSFLLLFWNLKFYYCCSLFEEIKKLKVNFHWFNKCLLFLYIRQFHIVRYKYLQNGDERSGCNFSPLRYFNIVQIKGTRGTPNYRANDGPPGSFPLFTQLHVIGCV